ncbi:SET and MYND domain-containing protein 4-like [Macrobrachium nipponense]|uniref:SET and MYND domain-containing protein 4-like n=1 Tax=Macrobrachium nipponense TaxID=159736 RepID=UPI0030C8C153
MASFDFGKLPFDLGKLPFELGKLGSQLTLLHYRGEQCLDEILQWAWDNYQFDCKALKESRKSEDKANMMRLLGNECYKAKNYTKALESYNQSILAAPHPVLSNIRMEETDGDAEEFGVPRIDPARYGGVSLEQCSALGKGFANRSAILLDLGAYEECLEDIDLALEYGYPEELRPKLEARRLKCQEAQRQEETSNFKQRDLLDGNLEKLVLRDALKEFKSVVAKKPPVLKDPNPCLPAFSSSVKVCHWPDKGRRGLVATRDIKPGEVLGVERAFAIVLSQDRLAINCSTCTSRCVNPLPCPGCCQVVFCSRSCQVKGLSEDHWLECKILSSVLVHGLETPACSYKVLRTLNFRQMKSICDKLKKDKQTPPEQLGFDSSGKYNSSSFQAIYHLNHNLETLSLERVISFCMDAFRLVKLLELSKRFFVDESGKPVPVTREDFLDACKILVNNYAKFIPNSFGTPGLEVRELFPAKSLINHSCSPVMSAYLLGREMLLYALKPIAAGEELTVSFIPDFSVQPKYERQKTLVSVKGIVCSCQACEENWPTLLHLPAVRCLCVNCKKPFSSVGMHCNKCSERLGGQLDVKTAFELGIISEKVTSAHEFLCRMQKKVELSEPISKQEFRRICGALEVVFEHTTLPSKALLSFMKLLDVCAVSGLM